MTKPELESWLRQKLAKRLRLSADAIDVHRPLEEVGIDSVEAVTLTGELETLLGRRIDPTALWEHRTVAALASFLTGERSEPSESRSAERTRGMSDQEVDLLLRKMAGGAP